MVAGFFKEKGAVVISADEIGWHILNRSEVKNEIEKKIDNSVIKGGKVNRGKLGNIVFKNKDKRREFNSIIHPHLIDEIKKRIEQKERKVVVVDAALVFEWGIQGWFDYIILVVAPRNIIVKRLKRLGVSAEIIKGRLDSQINPEDIMGFADFIIRNEGSVKKLRKRVNEIWDMIF